MSLGEFWINVRTGARLLAPNTTIDSPRFDAATIERALRDTTLWLTPRAVTEFAEADFAFLRENERTKLTALVNAFRQIAAQVSTTAPAKEVQITQGRPLFRDIVSILEFDRYGDAEAYRIGKQIEQIIEPRRPQELAELRFNTGTDSTDDPAIWIWAILKEVAPSKAVFSRVTRSIRELLTEAAHEVAPLLWPYVGFRTVSEQAELLEAARA